MSAATIMQRNSHKRKRVATDDVLTRVATSSFSEGRGSVSGWTYCPLCEGVSNKQFALGRGIAAHLHAVHAPWKPLSRIERKKQKRRIERQKRRKLTSDDATVIAELAEDNTVVTEREPWEPTQEEQDEWAQKVMEIVTELEEQAVCQQSPSRQNVDRSGQKAKSYRDSLPPFLQAAADGNLKLLKSLCKDDKSCPSFHVQSLLNLRDRNGSTAEHWAAGGGHLECLQYLFQLREEHDNNHAESSVGRKIRRRDGKTCLHYAARNGHVDTMKYLMDNGHARTPDESSGDGTTPLHLACYGGHVDAVEFLLSKGANVHATNDWDCGCAHWVGMTRCESPELIRRLCKILLDKGVSFTETQKQGHSALHKACQKQNRAFVEWMADTAENGGAGLAAKDLRKAGRPDDGGHSPSEIWTSVGGDVDFAKFVQSKFET